MINQSSSLNIQADTLLDAVTWNEQGLVPVIAQEFGSNDILMMAWMNRDALLETLRLGEAVYWTRSRQKLWHKGEESGHTQKAVSYTHLTLPTTSRV